MDSIALLPDATRSKLRSTQILTSLPQIISELIQNSLDAGARNIDVGVDCEEWTCWVRDDASGIGKEGMDILGRGMEAGRYGTSKAYAPDSLNEVTTFGFRGEALASCADICCLEISSRTKAAQETWSVIVKGSKSLYQGPAVRWKRDGPGTTVCIRDAFYNLPVRRRAHPPPPRCLDAIRQEIQVFSLVFPHVSFTLENTQSSKAEKDVLLRIPKSTSSLAAFRHSYGHPLAQHVEEVDATLGSLQLRGFISLDGAHSKAYQFLYINRHPITFCELHRTIDHQFNSSSFAKHAFDENGETSERSTTRRSPRKAEKKPVYVLDITVPSQDLDNCLEPAKAAVHLRNKAGVTELLNSTIQGFLTRHGFAIAKQENIRHGSPSPRKRRKLDNVDDTEPVFRRTLIPSREPSPLYTGEEEKELLWTDPKTGEVFVVDSRTGNSYKRAEPPPVEGSAPQKRTLSKSTPRPENMPNWIKTALEVNNIYAVPEEKIPSKEPTVDGPSSSGRFDKADISNAVVIEQVDRKFIACLFNRVLVLVDQHAADERIRVERFLKELCEGYVSGKRPPVREVENSVPVLLTSHEERQLRQPQLLETLAHWGFAFDDPHPDNACGNYRQVFVRQVPEVLADKLLMPDEMRDFLKSFLGKAAEDMLSTTERDPTSEGEILWLHGLRQCPKHLLELANSKACRGAIMFNDSLTRAQCDKLLAKLSKTIFPFQCAHGRPSMVPLIELEPVCRRQSKPVDWKEFG
ncbi:unnamed protein product [Mycena citricolor]|uniref:MutL C-terminal dimerisation domain-containing protein n=1 Tax=Mycena citricolor TaxID=2018698 RepID=A0AAD2HI46_9AGAR|nr:unnamed protein product [Mycena citricolor]